MARSKARSPVLPAAAVAGIKSALLRIAGVVLMAIAIALTLALMTYTPSDPSFNTATTGPAENMLGLPGSYFADLALQSIGFGVIPVLAGVFAIGMNFLIGRRIPLFWLRTLLLVVGTICLCIGLSILPRFPLWHSDVGPGGGVGYALSGAVRWLVENSKLFGTGNIFSAIVPSRAAGALIAVMTIIGIMLLQTAFGVFKRSYVLIFRSAGFAADAANRGFTRTFGKKQAVATRKRRPGSDKKATKRPSVSETPAAGKTAARKTPQIVSPSPQKSERPAITYGPKSAKGDTDDGLSITLPPLNLLTPEKPLPAKALDSDILTDNARKLESVLADFGVKGEIQHVRPGPIVTLYELTPAPGTKTSRVVGLADDIARSMSVLSARLAALPARNVIGIELANHTRGEVRLRDIMAKPAFASFEGALPIVLGKTIGGDPVVVDLAKMPHLLIAGTTGSGKSVALNAMILSLLYRLTPRQVRFIMIDPKMLELSVFDRIPHLLTPVVTEPSKAIVALKWAAREMENRYRAMNALSVRNIENYNARVMEAKAHGTPITRTVQTGFDPDTGEPVFERQVIDTTPLPYLVIIVDEMADLMLTAGKDVEATVQRLAQMARAAGLHIIMATQRPSVDVITGTIKANFPSRISFQVASKIDSRTILGEVGAEQLLGQGDMLYMPAGQKPTRVHGPFVADEEVEKICSFLRAQAPAHYVEEVTEESDDETTGPRVPGLGRMGGGGLSSEDRALFDQAVALVQREGRASISLVQRHLKIGYNRAATLVEQMETEGIVSKPNHAGKREVLKPGDRDAGG